MEDVRGQQAGKDTESAQGGGWQRHPQQRRMQTAGAARATQPNMPTTHLCCRRCLNRSFPLRTPPPAAQGVRTIGNRSWETGLAGLAGTTRMGASTAWRSKARCTLWRSRGHHVRTEHACSQQQRPGHDCLPAAGAPEGRCLHRAAPPAGLRRPPRGRRARACTACWRQTPAAFCSCRGGLAQARGGGGGRHASSLQDLGTGRKHWRCRGQPAHGGSSGGPTHNPVRLSSKQHLRPRLAAGCACHHPSLRRTCSR